MILKLERQKQDMGQVLIMVEYLYGLIVLSRFFFFLTKFLILIEKYSWRKVLTMEFLKTFNGLIYIYFFFSIRLIDFSLHYFIRFVGFCFF